MVLSLPNRSANNLLQIISSFLPPGCPSTLINPLLGETGLVLSETTASSHKWVPRRKIKEFSVTAEKSLIPIAHTYQSDYEVRLACLFTAHPHSLSSLLSPSRGNPDSLSRRVTAGNRTDLDLLASGSTLSLQSWVDAAAQCAHHSSDLPNGSCSFELKTYSNHSFHGHSFSP